MRVGDHVFEIESNQFFLNQELHTFDELPMTFGGIFKYTITLVEESGPRKTIQVDLHDSVISFKFYKHFLTVNIDGSSVDFGDSVGLLGEFKSGDMHGRDGRHMSNFEESGFEWQVRSSDPQLFRETRAPQLPYERCRMPTAARPSRRKLRQDSELLEEATLACSSHEGSDFELCVGDVMTTGDIGLATLW